MWRSRRKSTSRRNASSNFSCSSFKDLQSLCADHPHGKSDQSPPNKPSIVHRIRRVNSVSNLHIIPEPEPKSNLDLSSEHNASPALPDNAVEQPGPSISIPGAEKRIVVYLTSLRVVRATFEDCRAVQSILSGFRVSIDERDLSMDSASLDELQRILSQREKTKLTLPRVFIGGRYIGGADELRRLHEAGELKKLVEGIAAAETEACEVCGGHRFILCHECSGSHKCYTGRGGFRICTACNENGLIKCPSCCTPL